MVFNKVMNKGISLLLGTAMVITSITVNDGISKAEVDAGKTPDAVVAFTDVSGLPEIELTEKAVTVKGSVEIATGTAITTSKTDDKVKLSILKKEADEYKAVEGIAAVNAELKDTEPDPRPETDAADWTFEGQLKLQNNLRAGEYKIVAEYYNKAADAGEKGAVLENQKKAEYGFTLKAKAVTSATVSSIAMNPANLSVKASTVAAVTAGAVLEVKGEYVHLVKGGDIKVDVATVQGVSIKVSTDAAVAATPASAATFDAIFTVPANAATGVHVITAKVATKAGANALEATIGSITITADEVPDDKQDIEEGGDKTVKTTKLTVQTANGLKKLSMGVKEKINLSVKRKPAGSTQAVKVSSSKAKTVKATTNKKNKITLTGLKAGTAKVTVKSGSKSVKLTVTVKKAPKKLLLKDGKKAAKKSVALNAGKKKKTTKKYVISLPKNTASYSYKVSVPKKLKKVSAVVKTDKKGKQTLVLTISKGAKGRGKITIAANAKKSAKAAVNVKIK